MLTLIIFIAVLAILVLSHEFGHFIAARRSGMKVHEFGFGFPPRLFGVQRVVKDGKKHWRVVRAKANAVQLSEEEGAGTVYSLNLLPLGGFVKIKGEDGEDAGSDSFTAKSVWKKGLTLVAGVAMNVGLAFILLSIGFGIGMPQVTDEMEAANIEDRHVQIMRVLPGKPAELAGIKFGDVVLYVGDLVNPRLKEMQDYVDGHKDESVRIVVERGKETLTFFIQPVASGDTSRGVLGVAIVEVGLVRYPWHKAIYNGFIYTGIYLKEIIVGLFLLVKGLIMGRGGAQAVAGPVGIAVMTGQAARLGIAYLIHFTALLSLNLALINILPIPALDGGRLLFLAISKLRGRPIALKYEQVAHMTGFALLMLLVVAVTVKDLGTFKGVFVDLFNRVF